MHQHNHSFFYFSILILSISELVHCQSSPLLTGPTKSFRKASRLSFSKSSSRNRDAIFLLLHGANSSFTCHLRSCYWVIICNCITMYEGWAGCMRTVLATKHTNCVVSQQMAEYSRPCRHSPCDGYFYTHYTHNHLHSHFLFHVSRVQPRNWLVPLVQIYHLHTHTTHTTHTHTHTRTHTLTCFPLSITSLGSPARVAMWQAWLVSQQPETSW